MDSGDTGQCRLCRLSPHITENLAQELNHKWNSKNDCDEKSHSKDNKKIKLGNNDNLEDTIVYTNKFRCVLLSNLIVPNLNGRNILESLEDAANGIYLDHKNNDLYRFHQSKDIIQLSLEKSSKIGRILRQFIELITNDMLDFVEKVTGFELDHEHVDMTISRYDSKNYLLCHDDDIRGEKHARKVAFVYYLVDDSWSKTNSNGGRLLLYNSDEKSCAPISVDKRLDPRRNSFVFFETSPRSWHSVEEVYRSRRLSINGWFHSRQSNKLRNSDDNIVELENYCSTCPSPLNKLSDINDEQKDLEQLFLQWINHDYMMEKTWKRIRRQFGKTSEINLTDFLADDKYQELCETLENLPPEKWQNVGPFNVRNYKQLIDGNSEIPQILQDLFCLFKSGMFFMMLAKLTGLKLHPDILSEDDSESSDSSDSEEDEIKEGPKMRMELRLWEAGSYTLVHDLSYEIQKEKNVLDCTLHFSKEFEVDFYEDGGFISYIAKDEDEELLTIVPRPNCLSLVYRDRETARFVKYLSRAHEKPYYDISCVFYE